MRNDESLYTQLQSRNKMALTSGVQTMPSHGKNAQSFMGSRPTNDPSGQGRTSGVQMMQGKNSQSLFGSRITKLPSGQIRTSPVPIRRGEKTNRFSVSAATVINKATTNKNALTDWTDGEFTIKIRISPNKSAIGA